MHTKVFISKIIEYQLFDACFNVVILVLLTARYQQNRRTLMLSEQYRGEIFATPYSSKYAPIAHVYLSSSLAKIRDQEKYCYTKKKLFLFCRQNPFMYHGIRRSSRGHQTKLSTTSVILVISAVHRNRGLATANIAKKNFAKLAQMPIKGSRYREITTLFPFQNSR